jgi:hypothetical protein
MADLQRKLIEAFPEETYAVTIRAVHEGVMLADDLVSNDSILSTLVGKDLRGHIRRVGVMTRLHNYCSKGDLPFKAEFSPMPKGNWHWLEIKSETITGHVVRTDGVEAFPVDAPTRQDTRLRNPDLFDIADGVVPISDALKSKADVYAWLCMGANGKSDLTHLTWGVPCREGNEWLAHVDMLGIAKAIAPISTPKSVPAPDPKSKMKFRDQVRDALDKQSQIKNNKEKE